MKTGRFTDKEAARLVLALLDWITHEVPDIRLNETIALLGYAMSALVSTMESSERDDMRAKIKSALDKTTGGPVMH